MNAWKELLAIASAVFAVEAHAADKCQAWSWAKGDRTKAAISLASQVCLKATRPSSDVVSSVKAVGNANGYLLNVSIPLLTSDASLSSDQANSVAVGANLFVAGQKVWSPSAQQKTPSFEKSFSVPSVDLEVPYTITLGPATVNLQAGVRGEAGITVKADASLAQITGSVKPKLDTSAYALVQADVVIVKAGIQGNVIFAKGEGSLEGSTQIVNKDDNGIYLTGGAKATYELAALVGAVKAFADPADMPVGNVNSVHTWEKELFAYEGFNLSGSVFDAKIPDTLIFK